MPLIDHLFSIGPVRKAIWKWWYPFLTRKLQDDGVVFLNYAYETDPVMAVPLAPEDETDRACAQLYHHVGTQINLSGKTVLEVSCGHGGGASYLTRTQGPARYIGLDLNPAGVRFCGKHHPVRGLEFVEGDAMSLPFDADHFDAVVNVEASHCYPDFPRFLAEVARVLKPGGHFLYADFRFSDGIAAWEQAITAAPLKLMQARDISAEVLRGLDCNSERSNALIQQKLPQFLHGLGRDFAGVRGSRIYRALEGGSVSYRSFCFRK